MFGITKWMHELRERIPLVLLVAIVILWAVGYLIPQVSYLGDSAAELERAREVASQRRLLIGDREGIIDTYKRYTAERLAHGNREEGATAVMRLLTERAETSRVDLVRLNPSRVHNVGDIRQVGAEAELVGPLRSLVKFIFDLEHGADPLLVTYLDLRIVPGNSEGLEARITAVQHLP
jgi:hypothetical protein